MKDSKSKFRYFLTTAGITTVDGVADTDSLLIKTDRDGLTRINNLTSYISGSIFNPISANFAVPGGIDLFWLSGLYPYLDSMGQVTPEIVRLFPNYRDHAVPQLPVVEISEALALSLIEETGYQEDGFTENPLQPFETLIDDFMTIYPDGEFVFVTELKHSGEKIESNIVKLSDLLAE